MGQADIKVFLIGFIGRAGEVCSKDVSSNPKGPKLYSFIRGSIQWGGPVKFKPGPSMPHWATLISQAYFWLEITVLVWLVELHPSSYSKSVVIHVDVIE